MLLVVSYGANWSMRVRASSEGVRSLRVEVSALTDIGLVRDCNEDSIRTFCFQARDSEICCFAVADGIGGHRGGDIASRIAVKELEQYLTSSDWSKTQPADALATAFRLVNDRIYCVAKQNTALNGMGTTLTAALIVNQELVIGHVGDSRAYLFRDGQLHCLTVDHSLVEELVAQGNITRDEARTHPQRNIITRAMGTDPEVEVDIWQGHVTAGDVLVLCTDGLSDLVREEEIIKILSQADTVDNALASQFIELAKQRGAHDNVSIILARWPRGDER